jgi:hypothetical protein
MGAVVGAFRWPAGRASCPIRNAGSFWPPQAFRAGEIGRQGHRQQLRQGGDRRTTADLKGIAGASMRLEPGAMRELHWHPIADEWQ